MINEEKVKIMTHLASYESNQGKRDLEIVKRLKFDYISYNGFLACFFASIAVLILFAADFGIKFMENLADFTEYDFVGDGIEYLTLWIFIIVIYSFVTGRIFRKEYDDANSRVQKYKESLKSLEKFSKSK
jgi:hypothetical protein